MIRLMLYLLISMTVLSGCSKNMVVIRGTEKITLTKEEVDQMYSDNERLIKALQNCQTAK